MRPASRRTMRESMDPSLATKGIGMRTKTRQRILVVWGIAAVVGAFGPPALRGAETAAPAVGRIESVADAMRGFVEDRELAGAVTLVARDGKILHLDAVGWQDIPAGRPMAVDSLFSIASMTKPISAVAALALCEEEKLSLDEPVATVLPEFKEGRRKDVTLRQLLAHTSGMAGGQQNLGTLAETAAAMAKRPLAFDPGTRWAYSPGLTIAGRMVEVASGKPFDAFVAERITRPLRMNDTTFLPSVEQSKRLALLHRKRGNGEGLETAANWFLGPAEKRTPNPSGGLYSTAPDLFRFWQMLLNGGELDGVRILREESVREMIRPQTAEMKAGFVPGSAWGLGVGIVREPQGVTAGLSPGSFGHGGVFGTQAWVDPRRKAVYLLLIQHIGLVNSDASEYRRAFQDAAAKGLSER